MKAPALQTLAASLSLLMVQVVTASDSKPERARPTSHTDRQIEGWNVRIDERLLDEKDSETDTRILKSLESRLANIRTVVREPALSRLREFTIVLDQSHGGLIPMQYHPSVGWLEENGYPADLAKCVHIPIARSLIEARQINVQPWCVLHELAHAYHDQVLGFDEPRVIAAYRKYKASGHGDHCLLITGERVRHYGLTNHKEFFAEMSEAYFGTNDFFPFNRGELMEAEPDIHQLMKAIWDPKPANP